MENYIIFSLQKKKKNSEAKENIIFYFVINVMSHLFARIGM